MPSHESKKANLAKQTAMIEEGKRKHAQMEANIMSEAGEKFQRKFFGGLSLTDRQMNGLRMAVMGFPMLKGYKPNKLPSYISNCCKRRARLRRSFTYQGKTEDTYQCTSCYNDCEVMLRPKRKKK